jgi:predicted RND superfamily exporter protein
MALTDAPFATLSRFPFRLGAAVMRLILTRPWLVLVLIGVLSTALLAQVRHVKTTADLNDFVSPQSETFDRLRAYESRFGRLSTDEILLVSHPDLPAHLDTLEDFVLEMRLTEGVADVVSLFSLPAPGRSTPWLQHFGDLPPAQRLERMHSENLLARQLLAPDLQHTLVIVVPEPGYDPDALADVIQATVRSVAPGLSVQGAGINEISRTIGREVIRDLRVLTPAAVILCSLLIALMFRNAGAMIICALPPVLGLGWFLGVLGLTGTAIDPVMSVLPVVLIVLAFSDGMHLYHAAVLARRAGLARDAAIARATRETLPAAVLTSITTMIAFASLTLPGSPALTRMGLAGLGGMALCLTSVMILGPLLMRLFDVPRNDSHAPRLFESLIRPAQATARHARKVVLSGALVLAGLIWVQSQSTIGFRYTEYLPPGSPAGQALARIEASGLGSDRLQLVVETEPLRAPLLVEAPELSNLIAALQAIAGAPIDTGDMLATARELAARIASTDGRAHSLPLQVPVDGDGVARLSALLQGAGLGEVSELIGPSHAVAHEGMTLVRALRIGLYGTIFAVTVLIWVVTRRLRLALAALGPNLIPILGVEAWLVLAGQDLTILNAIALTVAFGIAVDDTVHVLNRHRLARIAGDPDPVNRALAEAAPPMAATSVILLAGLLVTTTSALPGVALYGGLIALAVSIALVADLFLLPAILRMVRA